jgi:hypothetical protein
MEDINQFIEELDRMLDHRIGEAFRSQADIKAKIYGVDAKRFMKINRELADILGKDLGQSNRFSDHDLQAIKISRRRVLESAQPHAMTAPLIDYVRAAQLVRSERWDRFETVARRDCAVPAARDLRYLCSFIESEFAIQGLFDLKSMGGGSIELFELFKQEQAAGLCQDIRRGKRLLDRLERAYREDLQRDVVEHGIAWTAPLRREFRQLHGLCRAHRAVMLAGPRDLQLALVDRLWGQDVEVVDGSKPEQVLATMKRGARGRVLLHNAHLTDWALLRGVTDQQDDDSYSCRVIGLVPEMTYINDMDPGTLSRFFPVDLMRHKNSERCIRENEPTQDECDTLGESVRKGSYGHYSDLLIVAALDASIVL